MGPITSGRYSEVNYVVKGYSWEAYTWPIAQVGMYQNIFSKSFFSDLVSICFLSFNYFPPSRMFINRVQHFRVFVVN